MGMRPGEAMGCVKALSAPSGCGTTEFCSTCGAVRAILDGLGGEASQKECEIALEGGAILELQVWVTPTEREGEPFTIFTAIDIAHEKRRKNLERTFFHDISNTASGVWGLVEELLEEKRAPSKERLKAIHTASQWLIDEVRSQKKLLDAEAGFAKVDCEEVLSLTFLRECIALYSSHKPLGMKQLSILPDSEEVALKTDPVLLRRVLINMIKNALEASPSGGHVTAGCQMRRGMVRFSVTNPGYIPRHVQMCLFQRSFSTKGEGRGVGTYAMKLFAETYLKGFIYFATSPEEGTTFTLSVPLDLEGSAT
ncbi:MAG: HAMP domain-containing histidine kinase [Desulfobacterales bacterium]|nr:HAMP domain-containing histidine kinase [Desulfobacterales bacterium]